MARDPNEVVSRGVWEKPEDIQGIDTPPDVDRAQFGTQFYAQFTIYKNGRRVIEWYKRGTGDGKNDPVLTTTEDKAQKVAEEWEKGEEKEKDATAPPGGIPTRTVNGQVFGWNPQTRAYDIPTGQAPTTGTTQVPPDAVPRIEGTPLPGGGFDNEAPIKVWRRPDGTVVKTESLDAGERKKWDEDREKSRNPGGKTDQQIKDEQKEAEARKPKPSVTTQTINGAVYTTQTTPGQNGGPPMIEHFGPDGKPVASLPTVAGKESRTTVKAPDGRTLIRVERLDPATGKSEVWHEDQQGNRTELPADKQGRVSLPPDAPTIDLTTPETARSSYMALLAYVDGKFRAGELTPEDAKSVMALPQSQVTEVLNREKQRLEQENLLRDDQMAAARDAESRRNNRAQMSSSMFSQATAAAGRPGDVRGDLTPGYLRLQAGLNQASGAYDEAPEVDVAAIGMGRPPAAAAAAAPLPNPVTASPPPMTPEQAAAAVGPERAAEIRANPVFRPSPPDAAGPTGWSQPVEESEAVMPKVAAVGTYAGPANIDERSQMLLEEGYSIEEIEEAKRRVLARYSGAG